MTDVVSSSNEEKSRMSPNMPAGKRAAELQAKMNSLVEELQGYVNQMQGQEGVAGAGASQVAQNAAALLEKASSTITGNKNDLAELNECHAQTQKENKRNGVAFDPASDAARLAPGGNSPPLPDQDTWMQHMLTAVPAGSKPNENVQHDGASYPQYDLGTNPSASPYTPSPSYGSHENMPNHSSTYAMQHGGGFSAGYNNAMSHGSTYHGQDSWNPSVPVVKQPVFAASGSEFHKAFAIVEFKRKRIRKYECPVHISTGEYVIVDGDRGQDCGLVVHVSRYARDGTVQIQDMDGAELQYQKVKTENGRVQRAASTTEVEYLHTAIAEMEQHALNTCRQRCHELSLNIDVVDCEYQFDGKKISFFFDAERSVDFRDLVKDLYRCFNARIWMENVNGKVKNTVPAGAMSHQQKAALGGRMKAQ